MAQSTTHTLPPPFNSSSTTPKPPLITQGAEALLYKTTYLTPSTPIALKHRPKKSYRHPTLDTRLTKARILAEARVLVKCKREGVVVPAVLGADWEEGWLACEWIEGKTIRAALDGYLKRDVGEEADLRGEGVRGLMGRIGVVLAKLHGIGVVHGDLTTSNLMVRQLEREGDGLESLSLGENREKGLEGEVVIIDFGLATQSVQDEDRAVDLYVLERAFGSTHPQAEGLFEEVLRVYGESYKGAKVVLRRLEDVRLRGRKKSMIG
ncbi:serine/threonine-protein kinase bud32 [Tothia fuscella]|uniref:EKC/KEOPS complex subunit BUD32 n=1 Tax=Tothia fuscella TaxID=1048955 RepID=A0A9P4TT51_9PEZI|nr:serine/threonine-protein kinase bud32 [Tothia fuscella]